MSLPMNFNRVFSGFRRSVLIELTVGDHVDGVWQETLVPVDQGEPAPLPPEEDPIDPDFIVDPLPVYQKKIPAIVLMDTIEQQQFYADGNSTSGVLGVICEEKLYIADVEAGGQERRQHYVYYDGQKYKVSASGKMFGNTNKRIYHCVRYLR